MGGLSVINHTFPITHGRDGRALQLEIQQIAGLQRRVAPEIKEEAPSTILGPLASSPHYLHDADALPVAASGALGKGR